MKHKLNVILMSVLVLMITGLSSFATPSDRFELKSNLTNGQAIPADYYGNLFGCSAKNLSPSLEWKNAPKGTKSFAITFFDESAPTGSGFWHYVLVNIPVSVSKIDQGDLTQGKIPEGSSETMNDSSKPGFFGPCPPIGRKHHYIFTVHALKVDKLDLPAGSTPAFVSFNLWANALGKASLKLTAGPRKE